MPGALGQVLLQACSARAPQSLAVVGESSRLSHGELLTQAQTVQATLAAAGLVPDEPVHVQVSNQPLDIAALLGVWLADGVAVPVHRSTPAGVAETFARRTRARWCVDLQAGDGAAPPLSRIADEPPPQRPLLQGAALIVFTSGSTGEPKGVVVAHEAFAGKMAQIQSLLQLQPHDRTLLVLNITFSFGLWVSLLTLLQGGTLVMRSRFDPDDFLATLQAERITRVGMVPTMMRLLFSDPRWQDGIARVNTAAQLRQIWIGGEALGSSLAHRIRERFSSTELVDIYGLTETATCDFFAFAADFARHPGSIGRPSPQVQYRIAGDGELQIRSPFLMRGYLDEPELTAAAYQDGWLRTGDLGRAVGDGCVELLGRRKELISRGGNKLAPAEIEAALCSHPDVAAALAVGLPDALLGERIHVLLVPRTGATLTREALRQHLAPRLERYKHPDAWHLADALPLGRTGKADRGQFKALVQAAATTPLAD